MLSRLRTAGLLACALLSVSTAFVHAEPRIALVVGNQGYATVTPLDNPTSDARLLASSLEARGFAVTLLTDANQIALNRAIAQFGRDLRSGGKQTTGLFYYAGHAVQSFGANYLLPTDVALTDAADLSLVAIRADAVLRQMASAENRTNIVILDACRNNPFVEIPGMDDTGLAEMKAPTGTFMAYSTAPGSVALDGTGNNSPFTEAMVSEMQVPGQSIEQMFKRVRGRVLNVTGGQQTPWDTSSLTMDVQFTPAEAVGADEAAAERFFTSIQQSRDPVQIVLFLQTYPESKFAEQARALLSRALDGDTAVTETASQTRQVASERAMIEAAQTSGDLAAYRAYLKSYPDGVFSELAASEIASRVAMDPAAPAGGLAAAIIVAPPTPEKASEAAPVLDVRLDTPLPVSDPMLAGQSIESLILGSPIYPPIEGLPEEIWKDQSCSNCHDWTPTALCDQATTYAKESGTRALGKEHPYGGGFKRVLRDWANGGCR